MSLGLMFQILRGDLFFFKFFIYTQRPGGTDILPSPHPVPVDGLSISSSLDLYPFIGLT